MLARLEADAAVERAEADVHGELLRVLLTPGAKVSAVIETLADLGFAAVEADHEEGGLEWYGPERVGELSRAEGRIIAERVIPRFAAHRAIEVTAALIDAVAAALHRCFVDHGLAAHESPAALREACREATLRAARDHLRADLAAALGAAVEDDLATRSTGRPDGE